MILKTVCEIIDFKLFKPLCLVLAASVSSSTPAQAVQFNFSYSENTPLEVINGFYTAGEHWSSQLTNDATINIHIDVGELPSNVIGGARPAMERISYQDFLNATFGGITSKADLSAFNNLQLSNDGKKQLEQYLLGKLDKEKVNFGESEFALLLNEPTNNASKLGSQKTYIDANGNENNKSIWLTRANAKALGFVDSNDNQLDASIQISNSINWNFNRDQAASEEAFDFLTMAKHEIGHILGFVSGVDAFELLSVSMGNNNLEDKDLQYVSPMDLFRYSEESAAEGVFDLSTSRVDAQGNTVEKFFSLDGGSTKIANFSTGGTSLYGDGYQASHWEAQDNPLGIMTPNLQADQTAEISNLDLQLLDVLGWELTSTLGEQLMSLGLDWKKIEQKLMQRLDTVLQQQQQEQEAIKQDVVITALEEKAEAQGEALKADIQEKLKELRQRYQDSKTAIQERYSNSLSNYRGDGNALKAARKARKEEIERLKANMLEEIVTLAQEQETQLAQLIINSDQALAESLEVQIRQWLSEDYSLAQLTTRLENATKRQLSTLVEVIRNATGEQRAIWEAKVIKALAPLALNPEQQLERLLENSAPDKLLTRAPRSTSNSTWYFWQTIAPQDSQALKAESTSVPEPSSTSGLLMLSSLGLLSWRFRRSR